jgi:type IV pilus assembly protein PilE
MLYNCKRLNKDYPSGFTLIELLVVVLIIGILAAIALPQYQTAVLKTKVASALPTIKAYRDAQYRFKLTTGAWATNKDQFDIELPSVLTFQTYSDYTMAYIQFYASDNSKRVVVKNIIRPNLNTDYLTCEVLFTNQRGQNVCKSLGGVQATCDSSVYMGNGQWYCYRLP